MRRNLIWLQSYPKSGNTWMRLFFSALVHGTVKIDQLRHKSYQCSDKGLYRHVTGSDIEEESNLSAYLKRIPFQQTLSRQLGGNLILLKTHAMYSSLNGVPLIAAGVSRKAYVIVRNPFDIIPSYADHFGVPIEDAVGYIHNDNKKLGSFIPAEEVYPVPVGSWARNVISWLSQDEIEVYPVRYEDLLQDDGALEDLATDFLGEGDATKIAKAIAETRFAKLAEQEANLGFGEKSPHSSRFFRRGKTNSGFESLTPEQIDYIQTQNASLLDVLGYQVTASGLKLSQPDYQRLRECS